MDKAKKYYKENYIERGPITPTDFVFKFAEDYAQSQSDAVEFGEDLRKKFQFTYLDMNTLYQKFKDDSQV